MGFGTRSAGTAQLLTVLERYCAPSNARGAYVTELGSDGAPSPAAGAFNDMHRNSTYPGVRNQSPSPDYDVDEDDVLNGDTGGDESSSLASDHGTPMFAIRDSRDSHAGVAGSAAATSAADAILEGPSRICAPASGSRRGPMGSTGVRRVQRRWGLTGTLARERHCMGERCSRTREACPRRGFLNTTKTR